MSTEMQEEGWYYKRAPMLWFWATFFTLSIVVAFLMGSCLCEQTCRSFFKDSLSVYLANVMQTLFGDLHHWVMMLLGVLMAYLTVMQLWRSPPPYPAVPTESVEGAKSNPEDTGNSVLQSNLAKTVMAGLGGLFAISALKPLVGAEQASQSMALLLYLSWYITSLFALLIWSARRKAKIEQQRVELRMREGSALGIVENRGQIRRAAELVYEDTLIGFLCGRKQQATEVLVKLMDKRDEEYHSLVRGVVEDLQENVHSVILKNLQRVEKPEGGADSRPRVRVSITLLAENEKNAFYLSSHPHSLHAEFSEKSIASLCLRMRQVRWVDVRWQSSASPVVLFSSDELAKERNALGNARWEKLFPDAGDAFVLKDWFQNRSGPDYEAFIVFPTYLHRNAGRRTAALHISFAAASDMHLIFPETNKGHEFKDWQSILAGGNRSADQTSNEVRLVLTQALLVLENLVLGVRDHLLSGNSTKSPAQLSGN